MTLPDLTLASICLKGTSLAKQSVKRQNNDYCTDFRWRIAYNRVQIPLFDIVSENFGNKCCNMHMLLIQVHYSNISINIHYYYYHILNLENLYTVSNGFSSGSRVHDNS